MISWETTFLIVLGLWFFFLLLAPVVCIRTTIKVRREGERFSSMIGRLITAGIIYILSAVFSFLLLVVLTVGPEPRPEGELLSRTVFAVCLGIAVTFGFLGWLGSVVVYQGFVNPLSPRFWREKGAEKVVSLDL